MYDVDQFCFFPYGGNVLARLCEGSEADTLTLYELVDASFERAARVTAVIFAGILSHTGCGKNPTKPVCVTAEGTTFEKSKLFRQKLDYYVRAYLGDQLGLYVEFTKAENATLVGTAVAGLLNGN
jgi:hexokinase